MRKGVAFKIAAVAFLLAAWVTGSAAAAAGRADLDVPRAKMQSLGATAGSSVGVTVRIRNAAGRAAGPSVVRLLLSRDKRRGDDRVLAAARVRRLEPGTSRRKRVTLTVPGSAPAGSYHVLACADAPNRIKELSERNNCRAVASLVIEAAPGGGATPAPAPAPSGSEAGAGGIPDADNDGVADAVDCLPLDPAGHPGAQDHPDPAGTDRDCDGIDGHPLDGKDVFVWSGAPNDQGAGTRSAPKKTLQAAVALADTQDGDVYAATGEYTGPTLQLRSGVSIYGGYDPQSWKRSSFLTDAGAPVTVIVGGGDGIYADGAYDVELQLLRVKGQVDANEGRSVYGIRATDYSDLVLDSVDVRTGNALPGSNGASGAAGAVGAKGGDGQPGLCDDGYDITWHWTSPPLTLFLISWTSGGEEGAPAGAAANAAGNPGIVTLGNDPLAPIGQGGLGAHEGTVIAGDGKPATGTSVQAPGGDTATENGANGAVGPNGTTPGSGGAGGTAATSQAGKTWAGYPAGTGGTGSGGGYGGGGGGGAGNDSGDDGSGGGGGAGGQGGKGGLGGKPGAYGGGSFGVYVDNQSNVTFEGDTLVTTGNGGQGGTGGASGQGGNGGPGGLGGKSDCSPTEVGYGGNGGNGGKGASGGPGGGGAGGPSIGLMLVGGSTAAGNDTVDFTLGNAGTGGASAPGGHPGASGKRAVAAQG